MGHLALSFRPSTSVARVFCLTGVIAAALVSPARASTLRGDPKPRLTIAMCAAPFGAAAPAHAAVPPLHEEELPWCVSADDPRCAPLHHDSAPIQLVTRLLVTAHADTPARASIPNGSPALTPHIGLTPRPGVQERVERPPRKLGRAL
jgi:hypothetical protein